MQYRKDAQNLSIWIQRFSAVYYLNRRGLSATVLEPIPRFHKLLIEQRALKASGIDTNDHL